MTAIIILKNIFFYAVYVIDRLLMSWTSKTLYSFPRWLEDKYDLGLKEKSFIRVTALLLSYLIVQFLGYAIAILIFIATLILFILLVIRFRK